LNGANWFIVLEAPNAPVRRGGRKPGIGGNVEVQVSS
jgi:hypothetical protein